MWVGHSLRLRSGQALSDAFEVVLARVCVVLFARGSPVVMTGRITSQNLKSKSKASDRACPERSRRECPSRTQPLAQHGLAEIDKLK